MWNFGTLPDVVIAVSWVPVFVVWHVLASGPSAAAQVDAQQGVALALLISFLHQPLTFGLVYGDRGQFALHPRLFLWAPVAALSAAILAAAEDWWIIVPVAAAWNLQHTVQQRYGVQRIYAARSRYGSARIDRALCYVPMTAVLLATAASPRLTAMVTRSGLDPRNAKGVELLTVLRPVALALTVVALIATAVVIAAAIRQEWMAGTQANPAKWLYQGAALALLTSIVIDPIAGFIAYVTAHAVEYAVIVDRTARRRYAANPGSDACGPPAFLARVARGAPGRLAFFGGIAMVALAIKESVHGSAFNAILYAVGALHFTYDAVIWKLRKPAVAKDFSVAPLAATAERPALS